jgi:transcriptional regulator with XRE-family HTH domain
MQSDFNKHLGSKLRVRRLSLGLTQTKVAKAINVTFQQIQKYEKGTNGVSSMRLYQLANYLKVPIIYFFEDYSQNNDGGSQTEFNKDEDLNYSFLVKLFSNLSFQKKEKLMQVLRITKVTEKVG